jgi:putative nucleotidyltransferase with HDIG domain
MADYDIHDDLCRFILAMTSAISNLTVYPAGHPQSRFGLDESYACLSKIFQKKREVTIALLRNHLIAEDRPLIFHGTYGDTFIEMLKKKAIDRITFLAGLPLHHLENFIQSFTPSNTQVIRSSPFIKIGEIQFKRASEYGDSGYLDDYFETTIDIAEDLSEPETAVKDVYERIKTDNIVDLDIIGEVAMFFLENIYKAGSPLSMLATLKTADEYTFTHAVNVGILTLSQAEFLGFKGTYLKDIGTAALLHDIGKILIPEGLLLKEGSLTGDERKIMEEHTTRGAKYLINMKSIPKLTVLAALEHHIWYDGNGYPRIRGAWKTNIVSQMIAISDVFDALRTRRPYREPMAPEKIEGILLQNSGKQFNPFLLERFLEMIKH